jgi:hypothetical protein
VHDPELLDVDVVVVGGAPLRGVAASRW